MSAFAKNSALCVTGHYETHIEVFKLIIEQFPLSWKAYDCLGEAYLKAGNDDLARKNYEKALERNSNSTSTKRAIEELRKR